MSRYKRRSLNKHRTPTTFGLNITSMTDMFTMLLVFLLQTYASTDVPVNVPDQMKLPISSTLQNPTRTPQVLITTNELQVDGKVILQLENGQIRAQDKDATNLVQTLFLVLKEKAPKDPSPEDSVLLIADQNQEMSQLDPLLTTISAAGFAKVKLATVLGN